MISLVGAMPAKGDASCDLTPAAVRPVTPISAEQCDILRPGASIDFPNGFQLPGREAQRNSWGCTANFMFKDPAGRRYMGTAGHCYFAEGTLWVATSFGYDVRRNREFVGELIYGVNRGDEDFALFRLGDDVLASPAVAYWGGPTGLYTDHSSTPVALRHTGVGFAFKDALPSRSSLAPNTTGENRFLTIGPVSAGDSGSPVTTLDGKAVGILTSYAPPHEAIDIIGVGPAFSGPRLDAAIRAAEAALGFPLELQTAPLAR